MALHKVNQAPERPTQPGNRAAKDEMVAWHSACGHSPSRGLSAWPTWKFHWRTTTKGNQQ